MFNKKIILILAIILVSLFAISAVSAADNATGDVAGVEETTDEVVNVEENQVIGQTDIDDVSGADDGTFTALQNKINSSSEGSTIILENDYVFDEGFDVEGIKITKSLKIDGNGHTIDGLSKSRIFSLSYSTLNYGSYDEFDLELKNIKFVNGYSSGAGGALLQSGGVRYSPDGFKSYHYSWYLDVINCTFTNCKSESNGGAIYACNMPNIKDSTFENNEAYHGGAVYGSSKLNNCNFIDNKANCNGGAIDGDNVELTSCFFLGNEAAKNGGAVNADGSVMACVFIDNNATKGGALWSNKEQTVQISEFINNHASDKGGAVYYGTGYYSTNNKITNLIGNSYFKYNSADNWGGAIYCYSGKYGGKPFGGYAEGCTFVNNECIHDNGVTGATTVDCIFRGNVVIDASDLDKYYGESENFTVKITEDDKALSNASVKITVNGKTSSVATDSNGQASIDLDLPVGTYDVVTECEDVKVTSKATVRSTIAASDVSGTYLNSKVTATFSDTAGKALASKQVIFKVGDKSYSANTDSNGVAAADIPLSVGTYTVAAVNPANNEQKTFKLTISKADSKVALTSAQSNEVITLTAALAPASARGNVVFSVNGENKNVAVSNGKATLTLKDLKPGDYKVTASYAGDNNLYASTSNTVTFSIAESYPVLSANPVTKTYGTSTGLVVYLKDNKANAISNVVVNVNINNKITPITTGSDGRATMPISLAPGLYTATITYADAKATAKITVKKATVKMTAKAKTFKKSVKTKKYTVTLKTNQNKGMKNTKVTIKVNKKTYSAKTNKNGVATFKLKKLTKKGKFTATVTYKGNACYKKLTKKVKITVK